MGYGNRGFVAVGIFGAVVISALAGATLQSVSTGSAVIRESVREQSLLEGRYKRAIAEETSSNSPAYAPYPNISANDCYKAENHDSADLCAQWRAAIAAEQSANAAWWSIVWTIVGAVVSGAGFIALLFTLRQTDRSLDQAKEANRIAQVASESGNRAWMILSGVPRNIILSSAPGQEQINYGLQIQFEYKNVGNTPAIKAAIRRHFEIIPAVAPIDMPIYEFEDGGDNAESNLGPGTASYSRAMVLRDHEFAAFRAGAVVLRVYQLVTYRDVFSDTLRYTETSGILTYEGDNTDAEGKASSPMISLQQMGPQNRMT